MFREGQPCLRFDVNRCYKFIYIYIYISIYNLLSLYKLYLL